MALSLDRNQPPSEELVWIGGEVRGENDKVLAGALVQIPELSLSERTDDKGRYRFARVQRKELTFTVHATGYQALEEQRTVPGPPEAYRFVLTPH